MEYILEVLGAEFDWAADLSPRYVWIWPYDQGGCGCPQCRPWGSNGFLKAAERVAALARRKLPGTEIILSTWFFNEGEWQGHSLDVVLQRGRVAGTSQGVRGQ